MKKIFTLLFALSIALCGAQNPLNCLTEAIICEDFEGYQDSILGPQSDIWTTWLAGGEGGTTDGIVSVQQAYSDSHSLHIGDSILGQDVLLLLGNQTSGSFDLRWKMFIPANKDAYFNIQNSETPGIQWNYEVYFGNLVEGQGRIGNAVGGVFTPILTFDFPHGQWFDVVQQFDLDNDRYRFLVNNVALLDEPYTNNIGAIDFFAGTANNGYWVDDVQFVSMPACGLNYIICEPFESYPSNFPLDGVAPWLPYGGNGTTSNAMASDGYQSMEFLPSNASEIPTVLSVNATPDPNGLSYFSLRFDIWVDPGFSSKIQVSKSNTPDLESALFFEAQIDGSAKVYSGSNTPIYNSAFAQGEWQNIELRYNLLSDTAGLFFNNNYITQFTPSNLAYSASTVAEVGSVFFYTNPTVHYYIDNLILEQLVLPPVLREVTIEVDMDLLLQSGGSISANGIHLAGNFQSEIGAGADWLPNATPMSQVSGTNRYRATVNIVNGNYQYKIVNGNEWATGGIQNSEQNLAINCSQVGANHNFTITGDTLISNCFDYCVACSEVVSTKETLANTLFQLVPNPATQKTSVRWLATMAHEEVQIQLFDVMGRIIKVEAAQKSENEHTLRLDDLSKGVYFVRIINKGQSYTQVLVVE